VPISLVWASRAPARCLDGILSGSPGTARMAARGQLVPQRRQLSFAVQEGLDQIWVSEILLRDQPISRRIVKKSTLARD
jgi:hypothetical protein